MPKYFVLAMYLCVNFDECVINKYFIFYLIDWAASNISLLLFRSLESALKVIRILNFLLSSLLTKRYVVVRTIIRFNTTNLICMFNQNFNRLISKKAILLLY